MTTTLKKPNIDLTNLFVFDNYEGEEQKTFMEEIGTLVFQSALMIYLVDLPEAQAEEFENFIRENIDSESFMEDLCVAYPTFATTLSLEMKAFCTEVTD